MKIGNINILMYKHRSLVQFWFYSEIVNVLKTVGNRQNTYSKNKILTSLKNLFGFIRNKRINVFLNYFL